MDKQNDLISRLQDEADLCRNDGASDIAALLDERTVQWGSYRKDRQAAMAATLERHRAVAERLRAMLRA